MLEERFGNDVLSMTNFHGLLESRMTLSSTEIAVTATEEAHHRGFVASKGCHRLGNHTRLHGQVFSSLEFHHLGLGW